MDLMQLVSILLYILHNVLLILYNLIQIYVNISIYGPNKFYLYCFQINVLHLDFLIKHFNILSLFFSNKDIALGFDDNASQYILF